MNKLKEFEDSGLQEILFINFGKDLEVKFCSCYNGEYIGSLLCQDVFLFKYEDVNREFINKNAAEIDQGFYAQLVCSICIEQVEDYYQIQFEPIPDLLTINCLSYEIKLLNDS